MNSPADPLVKSRLPDAGAAGGAEWVLFTDWCAVTGHDSLPATAETVLMFFGDCPAAAGTLARRLTAIDAAHRAAGVTPPERTGQVRDVLRGRPARPVRQELNSAGVNAALRRLPSHGWINGWFGRRDRALLVLAQAGVPYRRIAALTAGDVNRHSRHHRRDQAGHHPPPRRRSGGVRAVRVGPVAPRPAPRAHLTRHPHPRRGDRPQPSGGRGVAAPVPKPPSPHHRHRRGAVAPADRPPRAPSDRPQPLTPHSVSHLARGNTTGPGAVHRVDPQTPDKPQPPPPPATPVAPPPTPYTVGDWEQAVERRRADQAHLRGIDRTLDETDRKAAELNRRILTLLADQ